MNEPAISTPIPEESFYNAGIPKDTGLVALQKNSAPAIFNLPLSESYKLQGFQSMF